VNSPLKINPLVTGRLSWVYTIHCLCICVCTCACLLAGSPFNINVIDPSKATARGDGLDMVQCNQMTSFFLSAPSAQLNEFDVTIIGNGSSAIPYTDRAKTEHVAIRTYSADNKWDFFVYIYNTIQYNTIQYNIKLITRHM